MLERPIQIKDAVNKTKATLLELLHANVRGSSTEKLFSNDKLHQNTKFDADHPRTQVRFVSRHLAGK